MATAAVEHLWGVKSLQCEVCQVRLNLVLLLCCNGYWWVSMVRFSAVCQGFTYSDVTHVLTAEGVSTAMLRASVFVAGCCAGFSGKSN